MLPGLFFCDILGQERNRFRYIPNSKLKTVLLLLCCLRQPCLQADGIRMTAENHFRTEGTIQCGMR